MSIFIKGLEMPKVGAKIITIYADGQVLYDGGYVKAVPVPAHGRLKRRIVYRGEVYNALEAARINSLDGILTDPYKEGFHDGLKRAIQILANQVEDAPTIIPVEEYKMKYFEKQALLAEFSYATEDGSVLTYKDIEAILDHFDCDDCGASVIELVPQEGTDGLKRKYIVMKSDTGEPVEGCFVLRPDKDEAAIDALNAYADATENQVLAADIRKWLSTVTRQRGVTRICACGKCGKTSEIVCLVDDVPYCEACFLGALQAEDWSFFIFRPARYRAKKHASPATSAGDTQETSA